MASSCRCGAASMRPISAYRKAIAARPAYAEALFNLGSVLHQMRQLEAAEAAYRQVIAIDPAVAVAHSNLGTVLKDQGRLDAALAAFERAIDLKTDYAEAHYNRGIVLQQQGRREEALAAYGQAIALRPGCHRCRQQCRDHASGARAATRGDRSLSPAGVGRYQRMRISTTIWVRRYWPTDASRRRSRRSSRRWRAGRIFRKPPIISETRWREIGRVAEAMAAWQSALRASRRLPRCVQPARASSRARLPVGQSRYRSGQAAGDGARRGSRSAVLSVSLRRRRSADQWLAARQWIAAIQPPPQATL